LEALEFYSHDLAEQRPAIGTFLFNQPKHLFLQSKKGWRVYGLRASKTNRVLAQIFIHIKGKLAHSPLRAPFGSLELYGDIGQKNVNELLTGMVQDLIGRGVKDLQIRNYPKEYNAVTTSYLQKGLTHFNFKCLEEVSSIIPVREKFFEKRIAISQRQKLRKSKRQFEFRKVHINELKSIYHFINACRQEKNHSLSMTFPQLQKTVKLFPDNFILFSVGTADEMAAAAIVIKVSEKILYTFYYSHKQKFNKISPVVFLISGIYQYARQHKFKLIDLGTSMINSGINRPLLQFKKSISGRPSSKYIFDKILS